MLILSPSLFLKGSPHASLQSLCTIRRLFLLLVVTGLLVGTAAGAWLLGQCLLQGSLLLQPEPCHRSGDGSSLVGELWLGTGRCGCAPSSKLQMLISSSRG